VIRDGEQKRIAGREVARGDIVVLSEGDRVPADAILLSCKNFSVDESLLTGESMSVTKMECRDPDIEVGRCGGDNMPFVYSASLLVKGWGIARVHSTGGQTEIGKIGKTLQTVETVKTFLQQETEKLGRNIAIIGVSFCVLAVLLYWLTQGNLVGGIPGRDYPCYGYAPRRVPYGPYDISRSRSVAYRT
jgi:Ca2+-transporting ATPase